MTLSEKQKIEKATAEIFLGLYNLHYDTNFQICELSDKPDVLCKDPQTGSQLELEIALLEDLPGEARYVLGRGDKPRSPTTGTTVVSLYDDVMPQFEKTLQSKLLASYGLYTALVLRQVSILWEPKEWKVMAERFRAVVLQGKERHYGAGVWVICTDNSTWPASDTLFLLSPPIRQKEVS